MLAAVLSGVVGATNRTTDPAAMDFSVAPLVANVESPGVVDGNGANLDVVVGHYDLEKLAVGSVSICPAAPAKPAGRVMSRGITTMLMTSSASGGPPR